MSVVAPPDSPQAGRAASPRGVKVVAVFVPLTLLLVAWAGSNRQPVDATEPIVVRGTILSDHSEDDASDPAANGSNRRFRIGSFNIHGGRGPDGDVDLAATADVLRKARLDFAGLYEVHGGYTSDQSFELGDRLGQASVFAGTEYRWWRNHFGNGVLIGRPVGAIIAIPLPGTQEKRFRNALLATVDVGETTVRVLATHIDTETDRERQLAVVFELFRSIEAPAVLMGDLNCNSGHPPLARLLAEPDVQDAVVAIGSDAKRPHAIDHLLVRGLTVLDAGEVETTASDHPLIWAELEVPGE